jgi:glutathione-specific gamma-glutamylcyclotransferase
MLVSSPDSNHEVSGQSARQLAQHLARLRAVDGRPQDLWLFAYGSLIWRPDFDYQSQCLARVQGYHRALRMHSHLYRGTLEQPGLVLALLSGGSCRGMLYQVGAAQAEEALQRLWAREMITGVYEPRWLRCQTAAGLQTALSFTLSRRSPNWTGPLDENQLLHVFRHACGQYGSTLDYLQRTVQSLRAHGIHDRELERQYHLAARHGLCEALKL